MSDTQLAQMALSAIKRCNEQIELFVLIDILCGKESYIIKKNGFEKIKTFGAGKSFTTRQWHYLIIQMLMQDIFVINYDDNCYLKVTTKGDEILRGTRDASFSYSKSSGLHFKRQGYDIYVDREIQDAIDWRELTNKLGTTIYWNYQEEKRINILDIIPNSTKNRDQVVAKFIEIMQQAYHIIFDGDFFIIPQKVDLDMYGNEVKPLQLPFDDCIQRFKQYVISQHRYPRMNGLSEEVALRKWFREVGHGIIPVTAEEKAQFKKFTEDYPMSQFR